MKTRGLYEKPKQQLSESTVIVDPAERKDKKDCTVRAYMNAYGTTYDEAYQVMKNAGRKDGKGFEIHTKLFPKLNLREHRIYPEFVLGYRNKTKKPRVRKEAKSALLVTRNKSLANVLAALDPTKKFFVRTPKHIMAVVNGKIMDSGVNKNSPVKSVHEVL